MTDEAKAKLLQEVAEVATGVHNLKHDLYKLEVEADRLLFELDKAKHEMEAARGHDKG